MKVFCILSDHRAMKSLSPVMHTAVLKKMGIKAAYVPFVVDPAGLEDAIRGLTALNIEGANVTVPHKEAVLPFLDGLSPEAAEIGAVNTLVRAGGKLIGHNTDAAGFVEALSRSGTEIRAANALVVGTGGAAKAILHALKTHHAAKITVAGRNRDRTASLAAWAGAAPCPLDDLPENARDIDLLINAVSASSPREAPQLASLTEKIEAPGPRLVADLNYGREDNFWRTLADRLGARFMDGLPMLGCQAARSFFLWTGVRAQARDFMDALEESR
jgi:shikimate dehydrogenase